jgi:hypothetical protein
VAKFTADVLDTGGELANISGNKKKKIKRPYCYFQGLGEDDS